MLSVSETSVNPKWIDLLAQCDKCYALFTFSVKVKGKRIVDYGTDPKVIITHRQPCHRCDNNGARGRLFFFC